MALMMLVSLYTVREVLDILGVENYGIYNAIGGLVTSMSFLTNVLSNASNRFFSIEIAKEHDCKISECFSAIFFTYLIIALITILVIGFGGTWLIYNKLTIPVDRLESAVIVMYLSLLSFIIAILATPFQALLIAKEEMNIYAYVSIFECLAKLGVVYFLYLSNIDKLVLYASLLLVISILVNLCYFSFSRLIIPVDFSLRVDWPFLKSILKYSSWTLFGTISGVASMQGSSLLINIFIGPIANAAFAIATQVNNSIQTFTSSFYTAVRPPLIKSYAAGETLYMNTLFTFSNKVIFILAGVVVFPLMMHTHFVLELWLGEVSEYMVEFVQVMMVYAFIICLSFPITTIVQAAGKVKIYHGFVDGFALIILPINYILFTYNILSDAIVIPLVMVIVFGLCHFIRLCVLKKIIKFSIKDYFGNYVFPCTLIVTICFFADRCICSLMSGSIVSSLLLLLIDAILIVVTSVALLFKSSERAKVLSLIKK